MELIFILFGTIVVAAFFVTISNKRNKTDVIAKNSKRDLTLSDDDIIRLKETVGKFKKGEKHYCNDCDSVSIQLEEDLSVSGKLSTSYTSTFLIPNLLSFPSTFHRV